MGTITKTFIIQSLRSRDRIKSGKELYKKLSVSIPSDFADVKTIQDFFSYLDEIKAELQTNPGQYIIHIDCHGNKYGIAIVDKSDRELFIPWGNLRDALREIYLASSVKPIVSFSSCEGFNAAILIAEFKPCPFYLLTGSFRKIGFQDSVDGYFEFYTNLNSGKDYVENIEGVRKNFPKLDFIAYTADQLLHIGWNGYLKEQLTPERIKERSERLRAEIVAQAGGITKETEELLSYHFSAEAAKEQFSAYKEIFYS